MSAKRPDTGIVTAAASSVAVTAQDALPGSVPSRRGSSLWIGMTSDCMSDPDRLPRHSTAMTAPGPKIRPVGASGAAVDEVGADDIEVLRLLRCVTYTENLCRLHDPSPRPQ